MINDLDIVQWAYLLDPCFQLVNTAGKPLTEGYIEVYYHGTRTKYYCAADFDGTLHPFQIPLDSLGSNIVLASPSYAYDVYVYNKFGSLVMSRYNVTPGLGGGGGIPGSDLPEHWLGTDGEAINIASDAVNVCLPLPVSGSVDYEGEFVDHFDETTLYLNEGMYIVEAVIQFRQSPWDLHNSLNNLKIDTGDGDSSYYWQEDVSGPESNQNVHERKVTFIRKVSGDEPYPFFISPSVGVQLYDAKIRRLNIVKLAAGGAGGGSQPMYKPGPGIAVDEEGVISVTGMQPVSGMNEYVTNITYNNDVTEIFNEIHNVTGDITNIYNEIQTVTGEIHEYTAGSGIIIEDDVISLDPDYIASGAVTQEQLEGATAVIENTIEGVSTTIINNVSGDISAVTSVLNDKIDAVSAAVPEAQVNADWEATEGKAEILNKPDLSVYATKEELQEVTSAIPTDVVSHDELQSVTSVIENTIEGVSTTIVETIEGATSVIENTIEGVSTTIVNEYTGDIESVTAVLNDKIDAVSAAVPEAQVNADWNATEGKAEILNKPDLSVYATKTEVETATGVLQDELMSVSTTVSGIIADQVQSDWDEDDTTDPAYIKNKPEEIPLVAGENIYIERVQDTLVISASSVDLSPYATNDDLAAVSGQLESDIQTVSGAIPDVSEFATRTEVNTVSSTLNDKIDAVSADIPDSEEVEFEELDVDALVTNAELASATSVIENTIESVSTVIQNEISTVTGEIPDISNLATKDELESASGTLDAKIDAVSASIPEAQVQSDWTETATGDPAYIKNKPAEYDLVAGQNIEITTSGDDLVINAVVPPVTGFATEQDLQTVSAAIPDVSNLATKNEVQTVADDLQIVSAAIPDISDLATKDEVNTVAEYLEQDIQTVSAAIPDISNLATKDELETVSGDLNDRIDAVSADIPDTEEVEFEELDLSAFASIASVTAVEADIQTVSAAIPDISNLATKSEVESVEADVQTVSAAIPDVSNLATKSEVEAVEQDVQTVSGAIVHYQGASGVVVDGDTVSLDEPLMIEAGNGITFTQEGDTITISADVPTVTGYVTAAELATATGVLENDIQTVSSAIPDVSNLATKDELQTVSSAVDAVSGAIPEMPEEEEVEFEELDLSGYASIASVTAVEADIQTVSSAIPDVSNLATKNELETASGILDDKIDAVSGALPETQTLVAGANIEITESNNEVTISASVPPVTGFASEEELQTVSSAVDAVSGLIPETTPLVAGNGISITEQNDQIIIAAEVPTVTGFATEEELQIVSAAIPDVSNLATKTELQTVSSAIPEYIGASGVAVSGDTISLDDPLMIEAGSGITFTQEGDSIIISSTGGTGDITKAEVATVSGQLESEIQTVSSAIPAAQVNSDWTAVSGVAEILNKPDTTTLVAGSGIVIVDAGTSLIISASGGGNGDISYVEVAAATGVLEGEIQTVSASIPEAEEVEFKELDLSGYATISAVTAIEADIQTVSAAIPVVTGFATESDLQTVSAAVDTVSAAIPDTSDLIAGDGITIAASGNDFIISWMNSAGITDIQYVNALPASPVSSVLYLIPEA